MSTTGIGSQVGDGTEKYKLRLELLKGEIAAQANTFDQIDSKTGVTLGFTFVVVGQVLAASFRIAANASHFSPLHPCFVESVFVLANIFAFLGIICGVAARWPRGFNHAVEFSDAECELTYETLLKKAVGSLVEATDDNEDVLRAKGKFATATYV